MSSGAWMLVVVDGLAFGCLGFLVFSMVRSIRDERTPGRSVFQDFGLSIALMTMFFITWIGQGVAQYQRFTDDAHEHGESVAIGDFVSDFSQSTLENWQSEFLQLFAFVTVAALFIHKGSAESKEGDEKIEASLRRIEEKLATLPDNAPKSADRAWKLPDAPPYAAR
ncbi:MAG TPA: DUF6766 family protein [Acidimicrobiales bacterium]|nr:DUF6766 family protein [Acidimicrobiales bacterium]